jgi:hypothetical protein
VIAEAGPPLSLATMIVLLCVIAPIGEEMRVDTRMPDGSVSHSFRFGDAMSMAAAQFATNEVLP